MTSTVLVTGGSGFIGTHCILQLLCAGYLVRASVRSLERGAEMRATLREHGVDAGDRLSLIAADLTRDAGWREAALGCEYALHVASPLPARAVKHEDDLVIPARDGTLRVLRAARDAGVRRVVVTSSFAAIGYGHRAQRTAPFDETLWTDLSGGEVPAYPKSKTLAERAAWDFVAKEGGGLELATVNPVVVLGPVLGRDFSASILVVKRLLEGAVPLLPRIHFGIVDVRDVADLHLRAMTHPAAKGERFLACTGDFVSLQGIAQVLKQRMGDRARKVPTTRAPDWLVRLIALRSRLAKEIVPELGKVKNGTNAKARRLLGWIPRPSEEAVVATAESLVRLGLLNTHRLRKAG
ncbi:MAG TPA: aldehyde reductase [Steroidobacteraceae bacterium]|jgi:nucleoside-diphosphate-sugar epimerase|nr:aldehyde reductase [Steroidobacteraceae bacterium]